MPIRTLVEILFCVYLLAFFVTGFLVPPIWGLAYAAIAPINVGLMMVVFFGYEACND